VHAWGGFLDAVLLTNTTPWLVAQTNSITIWRNDVAKRHYANIKQNSPELHEFTYKQEAMKGKLKQLAQTSLNAGIEVENFLANRSEAPALKGSGVNSPHCHR